MLKRLNNSKKGQMKLSFGMIFSIILIIVFLVFAFYAVKYLLGFQESITIGKFSQELQEDVDKMWQGTQGSQEIEYYLPKEIQKVCFADFNSNKRGNYQDFYSKLRQVYYETENVFFYPVGSSNGADAIEINHLYLEKISQTQNPFCIDNNDGKIKMVIKKDYGDALVTITD